MSLQLQMWLEMFNEFAESAGKILLVWAAVTWLLFCVLGALLMYTNLKAAITNQLCNRPFPQLLWSLNSVKSGVQLNFKRKWCCRNVIVSKYYCVYIQRCVLGFAVLVIRYCTLQVSLYHVSSHLHGTSWFHRPSIFKYYPFGIGHRACVGKTFVMVRVHQVYLLL